MDDTIDYDSTKRKVVYRLHGHNMETPGHDMDGNTTTVDMSVPFTDEDGMPISL